MQKGLTIAGLAAVLMLAAAPMSLAQNPPAHPTHPAMPPNPPQATPATPATPGAPGEPGSPATPATPATPAVPSSEAQRDADPARTCRTFREVGQPCSCRSAPTEMGTAEAPTSGGSRNVCVVPRD